MTELTTKELSTKEKIALAEQRLEAFNKGNGPEPGSAEELEALESASMEVSPAETPHHCAGGCACEPALRERRTLNEDEMLDRLITKREAISKELDEKIKEEDKLTREINALRFQVAIDKGMFREASWALDIAKKGSYIILYTHPSRHAQLSKFMNPAGETQRLLTFKFNGLTVQFAKTQILLFGESEDQALIDFVKDNELKINIGMLAEAADKFKSEYNRMMGAIRAFMDQDGKGLVEDRREELKSFLGDQPRDLAGKARTMGDEYERAKYPTGSGSIYDDDDVGY